MCTESLHSPWLSQKHIKQKDYKLSFQKQSVKLARLHSDIIQSGIESTVSSQTCMTTTQEQNRSTDPIKFCTLLKCFSQINTSPSLNRMRVNEHCVYCSLGPNGLVTYGGIAEEDFNINPVTGVITTTKSLDRELQEYYTVTG